MTLAGAAAVVFFAAFAVFMLAALHPFVTYPLSLWLFARRHPVSAEDVPVEARPSVAICLSAYNEAEVIDQKVSSMLRVAEAYGPATVHIYTDGCSDDTVALLEPYMDRADIVVSTERKGKSFGMNLLLSRSNSTLLMFTDANVTMDDDALVKLAAPFADPCCGCTTARLTYQNAGETPTTFAGAIYWSIEEFVKRIESQTVSVVGVDGASFVVRRDCYHPAPPELIDDLYVTLRVLIDGKRVVRAENVVVNERGAVEAREEHNRKVRIACQAMNVHKDLWPKLRTLSPLVVYSYISHRLLKWLMPFTLLGAAVAFAGGLIALLGPVWGGTIIASGLLVLLIGSFGSIPGFSLVYTIVLSLAGVGKGVWSSLTTNETFTTWEPVASVRKDTQS